MKVDVLLGLQWGDEGKGKFVDVLCGKYDIIARFQGGPNAGHTLEFDGEKYVLHTIPSGIFNKNVTNVIGNTVVIDPVIFQKEIESIQSRLKIDEVKDRLLISKKAHLILPTHRMMDAALENAKGNAKIGSTLKGIGPTYTDKTGRNGIRIGDILYPEFRNKYEKLKQQHLQIIHSIGFDDTNFTLDSLPFDEYEKRFFESVEMIKSMQLIDAEYYINDALKQKKTVLAEGAQGIMLDIDYGSYPFVTSSNTITAGACIGLGVSPDKIGKVIGIFKAYATRVGSGPFPTELSDKAGENMRCVGNEFGSTTGRPRRCGWIDLVALKYALMINGVTELIMTKIDVMNDFDTIKVCTAYTLNGQTTERFPDQIVDQQIEPVLKEFKGWKSETKHIRDIKDLPTELSEYFHFIEKELQTPVSYISVGPDRTETIIRNK